MKKYSLFLLISILALSACGVESSSSSEGKSSGGGDVVVGTWGGDYEEFQKRFVEPELSEDIDVTYVPESTAARLTKVRIEKDGKGTFDVVDLADNTMQQLINEDLLMEIDYDKLSNAEKVNPDLKNPYFIPHIYSAGVLIYNENLVDEVPQSWDALWDPKYKGKIGVYTAVFERWLYAAAAVEGVADKNNWDESWDKLLELSKNEPKFYTSQEELGRAIQTGEVALSIGWKARAVQWNDAGGDPIGSVVPKEGTFPTVYGSGIPKNATNVENAYRFLDAMLDAKSQVDFATNMGYVPTVDDAELPKELQETIGFTDEELALIKPVKLDYIAENYADWKEKFDRELASK
ncbi:PotD/PotF family extracellular solute-binding protein [Metabacillus herbersteinensis]|uniref:PotD/PotF family extracellular solute-binding protein n=1 Tax=Metabacillus herbersteinensis TaxID=283816 RepID=A0ABV6GDS8_9BACI